MTRRPALFLTTAVLAFVVMVSVWVGVSLYNKPPATVPAGQTATVNGVQWHLDFIKQIPPDDPLIAGSYLTPVDGAAYLKVQYTYKSDQEINVCTAMIVAGDRQWMAKYVNQPSDPGVSPACQATTQATGQFVAVVPPAALGDINGVDFSLVGQWLRLAGHVSQ